MNLSSVMIDIDYGDPHLPFPVYPTTSKESDESALHNVNEEFKIWRWQWRGLEDEDGGIGDGSENNDICGTYPFKDDVDPAKEFLVCDE